MTNTELRDSVLTRLAHDLVGPSDEQEQLSDRPTQRYSTGILYPQNSTIDPEEDEDGGVDNEGPEDSESSADNQDISLLATAKPSTAGVSFAVAADSNQVPTIQVDIACARYELVEDVNHNPAKKRTELWQRRPLRASLAVSLSSTAPMTHDLSEFAMPGLQLYVVTARHAGTITVTAALSNRLTRGGNSRHDEQQHYFQVELSVVAASPSKFVQRPSFKAQTDEDSRVAFLIYRDIKEFAVGHTCSATAVSDEQGNVMRVKTDWVPIIEVKNISDRGDPAFAGLYETGDVRPLDAMWLSAATAQDLKVALDRLVNAYSNWIDTEESSITRLSSVFQPQARLNIERCRRGAERMREGLQILMADTKAREAFQLAQQAMAMQFAWGRRKTTLMWRPFQLGFQLLTAASIVNEAHQDRNTMDLLWFPTGGGKTEAYLAISAFTLFLRRLRGTSTDSGAGVGVIMRYTLRLLTVQQFQRAASMICACEVIRRLRVQKGDSSLGQSMISIGLWVGAATTPLTLDEAVKLAPDDSATYKQIPNCPCCHSPLVWSATRKASVVQCASSEKGCEIAATGAILPIWTISEEIYRYSPSLLIGTVDKFAQIVRNADTRALFGIRSNHLPPSLIIQDELHLISGPLGSMAGLYEVAIDELCSKNGKRPKIIGSTATIRRASEQANALFDRATYQFPSPGLTASNSGFAVEDTTRPGRLYVGVSTAGRSATYMLQAISASLLQASFRKSGNGTFIDDYWTLVVYFNSLRELGRALVLMQDDVPYSVGQLAARHGEAARPLETPAELTSRVRSYEIRDMLERLNLRAGSPEAVDLLLASNMISVGMDIPRLGIMLVNSQPKNLSEYIQATSRVGRGDVPGIIVTMYNNSRTRDRSHFETFSTWHRSLYRDVEATSVTPFASRAQDKALHAVLVALARHLIPEMESRPALDDIRRLKVEDLAAIIEQRVHRVDASERTAVAQKLKQLIDEWASRPDIVKYWDDFGKNPSLLMSAEQFAATIGSEPDVSVEGTRRALWPTPNSLREVEAGVPFVLRSVIRTEGG